MIQVRETPEGYEAQATIDTRWGPVMVHATAPTAWVDEALARVCQRRPELMVSGADFFADVKNTINAAAKSKVFRDVTSTVAQVASSPLAQAAVTAVGSPAAAAALQGVGSVAAAANAMAAKARQGDPRARRDVQEVATRARAGDPQAQRAARLLGEAFRAQTAKDAIAARAATLRGAPAGLPPAAPAPAYVQPPSPVYPYPAPAPVYYSPGLFPPAAAQPIDAAAFPAAELVSYPDYRAAVDGAPVGPWG